MLSTVYYYYIYKRKFNSYHVKFSPAEVQDENSNAAVKNEGF